MGVASHLGIKLSEYDARIRSFIPDYEEMLEVAAGALPDGAQTVVDLGIGTGGLALRCARQAPNARIVGIDADAEILKMAHQRLDSRASFLCGSFLRTAFPSCDAVVASLALHHVRTGRAKAALYTRIRAALRPRGCVVNVDYQPAGDSVLARSQMLSWQAHLRKSYSAGETRKLLTDWSHEDAYMPLETELDWMRGAGLQPEVLWRRGGFAVLLGRRR